MRKLQILPEVAHVRSARLDAVYIGRRAGKFAHSKWANPFRLKPGCKPGSTLAQYEVHLQSQPGLLSALPELAGKQLACWCKPGPCHGDVLRRYAAYALMDPYEASAALGPEADRPLPVFPDRLRALGPGRHQRAIVIGSTTTEGRSEGRRLMAVTEDGRLFRPFPVSGGRPIDVTPAHPLATLYRVFDFDALPPASALPHQNEDVLVDNLEVAQKPAAQTEVMARLDLYTAQKQQGRQSPSLALLTALAKEGFVRAGADVASSCVVQPAGPVRLSVCSKTQERRAQVTVQVAAPGVATTTLDLPVTSVALRALCGGSPTPLTLPLSLVRIELARPSLPEDATGSPPRCYPVLAGAVQDSKVM